MAASGLDLRAIEDKLRILGRLAPGFAVPFSDDTAALLAHCRAVRAALQDSQEYVAVLGGEPFPWAADARVTFQTTAGLTMRAAQHLDRVRAVLGAAQDGETPRS